MAGYLAAIVVVMTSCVVSNPPEYSSAEQTPPLLKLLTAAPSVGEVLVVNDSDLVNINVPVRSEDQAGDELIARLYLDYSLPTEEVLAPLVFLPAGSYDDTDRKIAMSWTVPPLKSGCRQMMLVVTHRSNLDSNFRPLQNEDIAVAVWWLNVNDANSDNPMSDCPRGTGGT